MVRASVLGAIDFAQADPNDRWWWKRLDLVLDEIQRQARVTLRQEQLRYYLAEMVAEANSEKPDKLQELEEAAVQQVEQLRTLLLPWVTVASGQPAEDPQGLWESVYGMDINSPEAQELIDRGIAAMMAVPVNTGEEE